MSDFVPDPVPGLYAPCPSQLTVVGRLGDPTAEASPCVVGVAWDV